MFARFSRSWALVKASAAILRQDRELVMLPVLSGVAVILVTAVLLVPAAMTGVFEAAIHDVETSADPNSPMSVAGYAGLFVFYVIQYFVIIFFNTALVGAAMQRLDGGNPTLGSALALAAGRIGSIFGYAVISATVGVVLRFIGERFGAIGRIVEGLLGFGWAIATYLAVPVMVATGVGPIEAVKRSSALLRRSFGENLIGNAGIGLVFFLMIFATIVVGGGLAMLAGGAAGSGIFAGVLILATIITVLVLMVISAALGGIYSAVLYRYADGKPLPDTIDPDLLATAFRSKGASR